MKSARSGELATLSYTTLGDTTERRGIEGEPDRLQLKRVRKCLDRQRARGTLIAVSVGGELCWRVR